MRYILLTTILFASIFAQGQIDQRNMSEADKMELRKKRMEQLKSQKESTMIGVQTSYLDLSPDQAQKFFPMQNEYKDQVREVQKKYREQIVKLRSKTKDASKFDVDIAIKHQLQMKEELAKLESEFLKNTTSILSNEQRTKLVFQEERMKANAQKRRTQERAPEISKRNFDRLRKNK